MTKEDGKDLEIQESSILYVFITKKVVLEKMLSFKNHYYHLGIFNTKRDRT